MPVSVAVIVVLHVLLMLMAGKSPDTCAGSAPDQRTLQTAAKDSAHGRSTRSTDQGATPCADTVTLVAISVSVTVVIAAVVAATMPTLVNALREVAVMIAAVVTTTAAILRNHGPREQRTREKCCREDALSENAHIFPFTYRFTLLTAHRQDHLKTDQRGT